MDGPSRPKAARHVTKADVSLQLPYSKSDYPLNAAWQTTPTQTVGDGLVNYRPGEWSKLDSHCVPPSIPANPSRGVMS